VIGPSIRAGQCGHPMDSVFGYTVSTICGTHTVFSANTRRRAQGLLGRALPAARPATAAGRSGPVIATADEVGAGHDL
jgi:hypothetical protein